MELVLQENINTIALENSDSSLKQVYPGELFRRCVLEKRNRVEEIRGQSPTQNIFRKNGLFETDSIIRSRANQPEEDQSRIDFDISRKRSRQASRIHDLKR